MQTSVAVVDDPANRSVECCRMCRPVELDTVLAALNEPASTPTNCPACGGAKVQRWGFSGGLQRFRCPACRRSWNPLTGTPLARLRRRDLWLDHGQALQEGLSIRAVGQRLGLHRNTSFRWRHRWLLLPGRHQDEAFRGIVEADTIDFLDVRTDHRPWRRVAMAAPADVACLPWQPAGSKRPPADVACLPWQPAGSKRPPAATVLVLRDRHGAMLDALITTSPAAPSATTLERALALVPGPASAVLCSSSPMVVQHVAGQARISCHDLSSGPGSRLFNVDAVRGYRRRLERWMRRFRGVSIRYLHHYLGWRRLLERGRAPLPPLRWLRAALGCHQQPMVTWQHGIAAGRGRRGEPAARVDDVREPWPNLAAEIGRGARPSLGRRP